MNDNPFVGKWSYRSFYNDPDLKTPLSDLQLGAGTIVIEEAPFDALKGTIGGDGWSLKLKGSRSYGNPMETRFQGTGVVSGEEWIYDYLAYLSPLWPNGIQQRAALVGTIVRTVSHKSSTGGVSPAGVVGSWYAVKQG